MVVPIRPEISIAENPISSEIRAPQITRDR